MTERLTAYDAARAWYWDRYRTMEGFEEYWVATHLQWQRKYPA